MAGDDAELGPATSGSGSGADLMPGAICSHELGFISQLSPLKSVGLPMVIHPRPQVPQDGDSLDAVVPGASSLSCHHEQGKAALPSSPLHLNLSLWAGAAGEQQPSAAARLHPSLWAGSSGLEQSVLLRSEWDHKGKYNKSWRIRGLAAIKRNWRGNK